MKELFIVQTGVVRCTMDGGETLLHTCVKSNRLEAVKILVDLGSVEDFISFRDDDGNAILHIATLMKQMETVKYLLKRTGVKVNEINANGFTALDMICQMPRDLRLWRFAKKFRPSTRDAVPQHVLGDFSQTAGRAHPSPEGNSTNIKADKPKNWVKKKRDALRVAAIVIAAMAYQAGMNPPSGVWNPDYNYADPETKINTTYSAGTSVMAANYPDGYILFRNFNTTSFLASMSIVLLLLSGPPLRRRFFMWILMTAMWVTMSSIALTYLVAMQAISPAHEDSKISHVVQASIFKWLGLIGLLNEHLCSEIALFKWFAWGIFSVAAVVHALVTYYEHAQVILHHNGPSKIKVNRVCRWLGGLLRSAFTIRPWLEQMNTLSKAVCRVASQTDHSLAQIYETKKHRESTNVIIYQSPIYDLPTKLNLGQHINFDKTGKNFRENEVPTIVNQAKQGLYQKIVVPFLESIVYPA
ncbi:Ankyrin repeat [Dillenia turbinata]|uniref:Ankyrin repeat n=1 Tax=Dillenia turbinata TaxID=194707 RepID=A0AAN8ZNY7_9MAGN